MEKEKKAKPTKKPMAPKSKVEMISYSIEMTIPTAPFANIRPVIVVRGGSIQEAHDFIAPHMNKLWKEYFMVNERRPESLKATNDKQFIVSQPEAPKQDQVAMLVETFNGRVVGGEVPADVPSNVPGPDSSAALIKATNAIDSCVSLDALELIEAQVIKSVKLSHEDKETLMPLINKKAVALEFPDDEKRGN